MGKRKRKASAASEPRSGDRVIFDAMLVADWLISRVIGESHRRSDAVEARHARGCVATASTKLRDEVFTVVFKREGVSFPNAGLVHWDTLVTTSLASKSEIEKVVLPRKVAKQMPRKDVHLAKLAVATSTRFLITADTGVIEATSICRTELNLVVIDER